MAFKAVIVSSFITSLARGHIFSSWDSRTDTSIKEVVEIPPSGGSRPVGAFGVATGEYPATTQVDFKADATLAGGMYVKGFALSQAKYAEFRTACSQEGDKLVSVYEWGYGACDNFMGSLKEATDPATTFFVGQVTPKQDGTGSTVKAAFQLLDGGEGLYVVFENLMGGPVTFSNAEISIAGVAEPVQAGEDLVFPPATVHMSAAVVPLADEVPTEKTTVTFRAKNTDGGKQTALMLVNKEQMEPERLGCTFGFYFGWFKKHAPGQNVCKGADFTYTIDGDILTLKGVIKAVTPETAPQLLAGDIPVDPTSTLFQGDGDYAFDAEVHGADSMFVVIPNRRDTPVTVEGLTVKYQAANLVGHLAKESQKILDSGPATGVAIAVLVGVLALMMAAYCAGKRRAKATAEKTAEKVEGKPQGNALV